jgi:hypothetical protein
MLACNGFIKQYTCPIEKIYALSHSLYKPSEGYMTLSLEAAIASGCILPIILKRLLMAIGFYSLSGTGPFVLFEMRLYSLGTINTDKLLIDLRSNCSYDHSSYT